MFTMLTFAEEAQSSDDAHPHQGKVAPFELGDPDVELDSSALNILGSGDPYQTQIQSESGGRGLVVQDVKAPTNIVWGRILDFGNYSEMVPKTMESENYNVKEFEDGRQTIYTRMKVGFPMVKLQFYVKHEYDPKLSSMTWTLDYTKKSDFDDSCGYWFVVPHPENTNWSRVYYSVQVSMFDWVPSFVVSFMSSKALTEATGWVKKYSELEYNEKNRLEEEDGEGEEEEPSRPLLGMLGKKTADDDDDNGVSDDETCVTDVSDDTGISSTTAPETTAPETTAPEITAPEAEVTPRVGLKRYAMVVSVATLALYNVHLYFSQ